MKLLYHGPLQPGSTALQRMEAFAAVPGVEVVPVHTNVSFGMKLGLYRRVRWRLRVPVDDRDENGMLERAVATERPDVVFIDSSRVIRRSTLRRLRVLGAKVLAYYSPDDVIAPHNLSWPLRLTFPEWDVLFTTKAFNIPELAACGVRRPYLIGKAFDPKLHRPMTREEVGEDFERYDLVFIGTYEAQRCASINALAAAGFGVAVFGGLWQRTHLDSRVDLHCEQYGDEYVRKMHAGRIALGFLRKLNRDQITQRTMEITAMARPMLAEKTEELDKHFHDGQEYVGFGNDDELAGFARGILAKSDWRLSIGRAARQRCLTSGYSSSSRAKEMLEAISSAIPST